MEFDNINFYGRPEERHPDWKMETRQPDHCPGPHPGPGPFPPPCPPPPFNPELKGIYDLAVHADHVAHKALDIAGSASLDAVGARRLAEQALKVLSKVSALADKANVKADRALAEIDVIKGDLTRLLDELNEVEKGAGLSPKGKYIKNTNANYISNATSLADADNKLDEALKEVDEKTDGVQEQVEALNAAVTALQNKVDQVESVQTNIIGAVGLKEDGTYKKGTHAYIRTATSVLDATNKLAEKIGEVEENVTDNSNAISELTTTVTQHSTDIRNLKRDTTDLDGRLDTVEDGLRVGLETVDDRLNAVEGQANANSQDIDALELADNAIRSSVNNLSNKVDTNTRNIATNSTAIQALQGKNLTINRQDTDQGAVYTLSFGGVQISPSINVDKERYLQDARYDAGAKKVILVFNDYQQIEIPVGDLFNIYEAGKGLELASDGKTFNVKLASHAQAENGGLLSFEGNKELDAHIYEGEGLESYDHKEGGVTVGYGLKVKVSPNYQNVFTFDATGGLQLNVGGLLAGNILGDQYINVTTTPDGKVQLSLNTDAMINLIKEQLLWQPKDGTSTLYIEPKAGKSVFVNGTIEATGAIYSGRNNG